MALGEARFGSEWVRRESRRSEIEAGHATELEELNAAYDDLERKSHDDIKKDKTREIVEVALIESQSLRSDSASGTMEERVGRCRALHEASRRRHQEELGRIRQERLLRRRELETRRDGELRSLEVSPDDGAGSEEGIHRRASMELAQARMALMSAEAQVALLGMMSMRNTPTVAKRDSAESQAARLGTRSTLDTPALAKREPVKAPGCHAGDRGSTVFGLRQGV